MTSGRHKNLVLLTLINVIFVWGYVAADPKVLDLNNDNIKKFGYSEWSQTLEHDEILNDPKLLESACTMTGATGSIDPIIRKACSQARNRLRTFQTADSPDDLGLSLGWGPKHLANVTQTEIQQIASSIIRDANKIVSEIAVETFLPDIFKIDTPRGGRYRCYNRYIEPDGWPFRAKCIEPIRRRWPCRWCPRVHCGDRYFMPVYYRQVSLIIETPKTLLHSRRFPGWLLNFQNSGIPSVSREMIEEYVKFNQQMAALGAWLRGEVVTNSDFLRLQGLKALKYDDSRSVNDLKDLLDAEASLENQILASKLGSGASLTNPGSANPVFSNLQKAYDLYANSLASDRRFAGTAMSNPLLLKKLGSKGATMVGHFPISNPLSTQFMRAVDIESNGGNDRTNIHPMVEFDWCHMFGMLIPGIGSLEGVAGAAEFLEGVGMMIQNTAEHYTNFARQVASHLSNPNLSVESLFTFMSGESWTKRTWHLERPNIGERVGLPMSQLADLQRSIQQAFPTHRIGSRALNFRFERVNRKFCNESTGEPPLPPARWLDKKYAGHSGFNPNAPRDGDLNVVHFFDRSQPLESIRRLSVLAYSPDFPDILAELKPDLNPLRVIQPGGQSKYPLGSFLSVENPALIKFFADSGVPEHTRKLVEFLTRWNSPFRALAFDECSPFEAKPAAGVQIASIPSNLNPFSVLQPLLKGNEISSASGERQYRRISQSTLGRTCLVGQNIERSSNFPFEFEAQAHAAVHGLNTMLRHAEHLLSKNQIEARTKDEQSLAFLSHDRLLNFHPDRPILNSPGSERCRTPARLTQAEATTVARAGDSNPMLEGSQRGQEFWLWTERTCCLRGSPRNGYTPYGS